jgi:hypothetical protein
VLVKGEEQRVGHLLVDETDEILLRGKRYRTPSSVKHHLETQQGVLPVDSAKGLQRFRPT